MLFLALWDLSGTNRNQSLITDYGSLQQPMHGSFCRCLMRWVWPTTRYVRLSHRPQQLLSTTRESLLRPCRAHSRVQNNVRQPFAPLGVLSGRPKHQLPKEQAVVECDNLTVNQAEHSETDEPRKVKADTKGFQQGDVPDRAKSDRLATVEHADSAKPTKTASSVETAEPAPLEPVKRASYKKIKEYANANRTTVAGDPDTRPSDHSSVCSADKQPQDPPPTTSSGCSIDVRGQLRIKSKVAALRKLRTALIVSSVSRNLVEADFTRLLAYTSEPGKGRGGFIRGNGSLRDPEAVPNC